jgi:Domain of unknown function (DUF4166)
VRYANTIASGREFHRAAEVALRHQFRSLVGETQWLTLPAAVQRRFDRELVPGESAGFIGEVAVTRLHWVGRYWARVAQLFGAPLPLRALSHTPAAVLVTADSKTDSQIWTRIYHEPGRLPQVIRSMKRFAGPSGLEECVGAGIGMALTVSAENRALVFRSSAYFVRLGRYRVRVPYWLTPGTIEVRHREERAGTFGFALTVTHPVFGEIIYQLAFFRDVL